MPRLTKDQWEAARLQWEADPTLAFTEIAKGFGVSEAAVRQRAKAESWIKTGSMKGIAERAQLKADEREVAKLRTNFEGEVQKRVAVEVATDIRADVIERHRADWAEHRAHYQTGDIASDFDLGKSAKISAEMLAIRQKAERAAYGLDEATGNDTVEVVRSYGVKP